MTNTVHTVIQCVHNHQRGEKVGHQHKMGQSKWRLHSTCMLTLKLSATVCPQLASAHKSTNGQYWGANLCLLLPCSVANQNGRKEGQPRSFKRLTPIPRMQCNANNSLNSELILIITTKTQFKVTKTYFV